MAILDIERLEKFRIDPAGVAAAMSKLVSLIQEIGIYTQFMTNKITAVNDSFASKNYDRITAALSDCQNKIGKAQEELSELLASCNKLLEKINLIES